MAASIIMVYVQQNTARLKFPVCGSYTINKTVIPNTRQTTKLSIAEDVDIADETPSIV